MPLIKSKDSIFTNELVFDSLDSVISYYKSQDSVDKKHYALENMVEFNSGVEYLISLLDNEIDSQIIAFICSILAKLDPKNVPIDSILELLKSENALLRNLIISVLQDYGEEIKYYIVKYLISDDKDLRIFAINVLGDVNFAESRDMIIELLQNELDLNVAMTAVDYLAEIGQDDDIELLLSLKNRFKSEPYVEFAIDSAIKSIRG